MNWHQQNIKLYLALLIVIISCAGMNKKVNLSRYFVKSIAFRQSFVALPSKAYGTPPPVKADSLLALLHNEVFVEQNKNNGCCLDILEALASNVNYPLHKTCNSAGFFPEKCSYASHYLYDSMAFLYRYDLRQLITMYGYKDSLKIDSLIYSRFQISDCNWLKVYRNTYNLNDNLSQKYHFEDCRNEKFEWPNLKSAEVIHKTFDYLLWEDSSLFADYQYILCKKNFLMWALASHKGYRLDRFKDGEGSFEFYLNGCYLQHNFSKEFKADLRKLMHLYHFSDSASYIKQYW